MHLYIAVTLQPSRYRSTTGSISLNKAYLSMSRSTYSFRISPLTRVFRRLK